MRGRGSCGSAVETPRKPHFGIAYTKKKPRASALFCSRASKAAQLGAVDDAGPRVRSPRVLAQIERGHGVTHRVGVRFLDSGLVLFIFFSASNFTPTYVLASTPRAAIICHGIHTWRRGRPAGSGCGGVGWGRGGLDDWRALQHWVGEAVVHESPYKDECEYAIDFEVEGATVKNRTW